jgi:hypothetical protein
MKKTIQIMKLVSRGAMLALVGGVCAMLVQASAAAQQLPAPPQPEEESVYESDAVDGQRVEQRADDFPPPPPPRYRHDRGREGGREFGGPDHEGPHDRPMSRDDAPGPHGRMRGPGMPPPPPPPPRFEDIDTDGDGNISRTEFDESVERARQRHERMRGPGGRGQDRGDHPGGDHAKGKCDRPEAQDGPAPENSYPDPQR